MSLCHKQGFNRLSKSVFSDGLCQLTYDNICFFLHKIVAYDVICFKVTLPCKILTKLIILREILSFCQFRGFSRLSKSGFSDGLCQHTYDIICFFFHRLVAYEVICFKETVLCKILTKLMILREILSLRHFGVSASGGKYFRRLV